MSSLLFWGPYLTHKAIISHKREKQRQNNYSRWEGLRDDHDAMKRATPPRQPLDPQPRRSLSPDRDLVTLRDQQEAGDARTAWTPQERWQPRGPPLGTSGVGAGAVGVQRQKTGAAWDEALPPPMRVSRRRWGERGTPMEEARLSTDSSRQDVMGVSGGRGSGSLNREEEEEEEERRRKNDEVDVVESPYEWWK